MGIFRRIVSMISPSDRTEIQFHRIHSAKPNGERAVVTYVTGDLVDKPTVVGSTAQVTIPSNSVLVEHDDEDRYTELNGKPYPVYDYTLHDPSEVPDGVSKVSLPTSLTDVTIPEREWTVDDVETLEEVLP
jgi:hypothetical protein